MLLALAAGHREERRGALADLSAAGSRSSRPNSSSPASSSSPPGCSPRAGKRPDMPALPLASALLAASSPPLVLQPDIGQTALLRAGLGRPVLSRRLFADLDRARRGRRRGRLRRRLFHRRPRAQPRGPVPVARARRHPSDRYGALWRSARAAGWGAVRARASSRPICPTPIPIIFLPWSREEFGIIFCLFLVVSLWVYRLAWISGGGPLAGCVHRLALSGLMMLFGFQTLINMAVNVDLLPAKGMTLPFLSYGGSSLTAMALTMGLALGLARRRPEAASIYGPCRASGGRRDFLQGDKDLTGASIVLTAGGTGGHLFPGAGACGRDCAGAATRSI